MPGYFNYSPWTDAANYGRGFGQTLAQALIRAPQERENLAEQRARFPLEQELTEAQIHSALAQPELRKMMYDAAMGRNANQKEHYENEDANAKERTGNTKDYNEKRVKLGQQNADTRTAAQQEHASYDSQKQSTSEALAQGKIALEAIQGAMDQKRTSTMGQESGAKTDAQVGRAMAGQKLLGMTLPGGSTNTQMSASVAEQAAKEQQDSPTNSMLSILSKYLHPMLETNKPGWLHPFTGETVVTNGAKFSLPGQPPPMTQGAPVPVAQQPMANAPAPIVPHGFVRVLSPDGTTVGNLPQEKLAEALARGAKLVH